MERALISKFRALRTPDANENIFVDIWKKSDGTSSADSIHCKLFFNVFSSPSNAISSTRKFPDIHEAIIILCLR